MWFLQLNEPETVLRLHQEWLALAEDIVATPTWTETSAKMQESYSLLKKIEAAVYQWFFEIA